MQAARSIVGTLSRTAADFLLPPRCAVCGDRILEHGHLCASCWGKLKPIGAPFCDRCGLPFDYGIEESDGPLLCGACLANPPDYDWARAAVLYDELGKRLVLSLKHGGEGSAVPVMARMMAAALAGRRGGIDLILPVPLHPKRLFSRRFNQSQLIAAEIGRQTGLSVDPFVLKRRKPTPSQGHLGRKARAENMVGAFRVDNPEKVKGRHMLLVDDVLTSGATANACARCLIKAGAQSVAVLAFARVALPFQ